jgi:alkylhydroperoxidase/carboxymuconolactone decarboxylase family protein YurZ
MSDVKADGSIDRQVAFLTAQNNAVGRAVRSFLDALARDPALEPKTRMLVLLAVQSALGPGRDFEAQVVHALDVGATRAQIVSAITLGLLNNGLAGCLAALPRAVRVLENHGA